MDGSPGDTERMFRHDVGAQRHDCMGSFHVQDGRITFSSTLDLNMANGTLPGFMPQAPARTCEGFRSEPNGGVGLVRVRSRSRARYCVVRLTRAGKLVDEQRHGQRWTEIRRFGQRLVHDHEAVELDSSGYERLSTFRAVPRDPRVGWDQKSGGS